MAHGWSSGPTAWLSENVLGVRDVHDGYRTVTIAPDLLGLDWVKGSVPTPRGLITIELDKSKGLTLDLPAGVSATYYYNSHVPPQQKWPLHFTCQLVFQLENSRSFFTESNLWVPLRRRFLYNSAIIGSAAAASRLALADIDKIKTFRTPYKYPKLILSATGRKGDFDERSVDDPIVFYANGAFQMLYIGWDGVGYQAGLVTSKDLVNWTRTTLVAPRNPASTYT
jgi:hypothetical protein